MYDLKLVLPLPRYDIGKQAPQSHRLTCIQAPAKESVNSVKRMPKAFTDWLKDNKSRIATAKSQPYFIRDNATAVSNIILGVLPESMAPATTAIPIAERAQMRHDARTPEEIQSIKNAWNERRQKVIAEAGRELNSWVENYLPTVLVGKFLARRIVLEDPEDGTQIILNKTFFKEVRNKYQDDHLYLEKLKFSRDIEDLFKKARHVRNETSSGHPDATFRVYEAEAGDYIAEIKVKCNADAQILYIMRLINKK